MNVTVLSGQSLFDLAVQTCGDATAAIAQSIANGMPLTEALRPASLVKTVPVVSRDIANYYKNRNLTPATAFTGTLESAGIFDGTFDETFE